MRVALTGAATGIGASVASILKECGATVVALDLNRPAENVDTWIKTDLSDLASIKAAVDQVDGSFDALINNAGIPPREGLTEEVLRVNYFGLKQVTNAMLNKLNPGSAVVNNASRAGASWRDNIDEVRALMALDGGEDLATFISDRGIDHVRAYNLSKEAVIALTMASTESFLERELRMNCVSPAAVSTGILEDFKIAFGERATKAIARAGRPGNPDEIAEVIVFLASPESGWIKGQDVTIDGGMTGMAMADTFGLSKLG